MMNRFDRNADAITDLYRAAFYLAKKSRKVGMTFFLKANKKLGDKISFNVDDTTEDYLYWAEKVLDEYKRLKMNLSSN